MNLRRQTYRLSTARNTDVGYRDYRAPSLSSDVGAVFRIRWDGQLYSIRIRWIRPQDAWEAARRVAWLRRRRHGRQLQPGGASIIRRSFREKPTRYGLLGSSFLRTIRRNWTMVRTPQPSSRQRLPRHLRLRRVQGFVRWAVRGASR